jgi:hypothetical protein
MTAAVAVLTFINVLLVSLAANRGLEYMGSVSFCGQFCHVVMEPEFVAHQAGPHSRIKCVSCHVGPGATGLVRSKLAGTRQLVALSFNSFQRPVPSPVHNLRPAEETCEGCHSSEKFSGDRLQVVREFADDEANTPTDTTLRLHVGGTASDGRATGIHWHADPNTLIEFVASDDTRRTIPVVRLTDRRTGARKEFVAEGTDIESLAGREARRMDCVDCHNRPTHVLANTAERAVNAALASGELPADLPFLRREAVAALKAEYPSREEAYARITSAIRSYYEQQHAAVARARQADVDRAVRALQALYGRNVFPRMRVTWGTHPNHLGHVETPGCFRCHDEQHKTTTGETIRQDCELCHAME